MSWYTIKKDTTSKKFILKILRWEDVNSWKLRKVLDPHGNREINRSSTYKFNTKDEAETLIIIAKLKGLL